MSKKLLKNLSLFCLGMTITICGHLNSANAVSFEAKPVKPGMSIALATLMPSGQHKLNVIEQIPNQRACWKEFGNNPTQVDPLLLNFDFSKDCRRYDVNSFSVRINGQDENGYKLRIRREKVYSGHKPNFPEKPGFTAQREVLVLEAWQPHDRAAQPIKIAQANSASLDHVKLDLEPGWSLSRRVFEGKPVGHIYFSFNLKSDSRGQWIPLPTRKPDVRAKMPKPASQVKPSWQLL